MRTDRTRAIAVGGGALVALLAFSSCCAPRQAAAPPPSAFVALADAYYAAIAGGDWEEVAARTHSASLEAIKRMVVSLTAVDERTSGIPFPSQADLPSMLGVDDLEEIAEMTPEQVFLLIMNRDVSAITRSILVGTENATRAEYVGVLSQGDSLRYVVRRAEYTGEMPEEPGDREHYGPPTRMDVLTLKRDRDSRWRVLTDTNIELPDMLRAVFLDG